MKCNDEKTSRITTVAPDEEVTVRSRDEISNEMGKVLEAKKTAEKKIIRCDKRLAELSKELQLANTRSREVK